tara:strand:+ start:277 stop:723 length:447 start_codon:yes stop_codon:yes gene_type:complete
MTWYKFYIVKMDNKKYVKPNDGRILVKFGITHHMDVMKRFNPSVNDGYVKNYEDWDIRVMYSQVFYSKEEALAVETHMKDIVFPPTTHKVWLEDYLQCESRDEYYNNSGVTEFRLLTQMELSSTINTMKLTQSQKQQEAKGYKRQSAL